ncbi:Myb-like DNA-binding domain containing protein [Tritrichomonas foetus]|uniref:Myb-like DNA-binding domain containing protein n=1 Tax=Tritrichomonas foetus TaxID=1144522 RepID=A0A1J4JY44_9EUKA|nr:Myb-like DNA-binding domain containing protein [Tritrichomonas foetus]|eukprot:OHT03610.1 Myb-like DNA-binding domain containing protein [Tritrichomonas foetus]
MGRNWNEEEDNMLRELIVQYGKQWSVIASHIPNRTATQIAARWEKCINPKLTKGPFNSEEDRLIIEFVEEFGCHAWPKITSVLPHRTPKQCRERWFNNLDPSVTKTPWTPEEDDLIFSNYLKFGPKWSTIAHLIPGRTDNSIKNRWNASISKRVKVDADGNKTLAPCKVRKYSKKNKLLEQARPEALSIKSYSSPIQSTSISQPTVNFDSNSNFITFDDAPLSNLNAYMVSSIESSNTSSDISSNNSSSNSSPIPDEPSTEALPSPFLLATPTFDTDPFNGVDLPFSPFSMNFPTTPDFCSPRGFGFNLKSPLFSPCGPHAFDDF